MIWTTPDRTPEIDTLVQVLGRVLGPSEPQDGFYRLLYGRHPVHTFAKTQNTPLLNELYPEMSCGSTSNRPQQRGLPIDHMCGWKTRMAPGAVPFGSR